MEQQIKNKSGWTLPWIITGVLLLVLLGYLWYMYNRKVDPIEPTTKTETPIVPKSDPTVAAYVRFIEEGNNKMSLDHQFTSEALHKLGAATTAMAAMAGDSLAQPLDSVQRYADNITEDKYAVSHADDIRRASNIIADALAALQQAKFPALSAEAAGVRAAASNINPDRLTLEQRDEVKGFFRAAADLLKKMNVGA